MSEKKAITASLMIRQAELWCLEATQWSLVAQPLSPPPPRG